MPSYPPHAQSAHITTPIQTKKNLTAKPSLMALLRFQRDMILLKMSNSLPFVPGKEADRSIASSTIAYQARLPVGATRARRPRRTAVACAAIKEADMGIA